MLELLLDATIDSLKLIPFLWLTYFVMEILEHKSSLKAKERIKKAGKVGPLWGAVLGAFPQCGFSSAASSMYAGRVITLGTLFSIYLSTSDEMLPILISEAVPVGTILKLLGTKIIIGMLSGFFVDFFIRMVLKKEQQEMDIHTICEEEKCHCSDGVLISSIKHTLKIFLYILLLSVAINIVIEAIGLDVISGFLAGTPVLSEFLAGLVGLIPNCVSSVVLTQLYLQGILSAGAMMSGLLVNAGVGILVLCRLNRNYKENIAIIGGLYLLGIAWGIVISTLGIVF